MKSALRRATWLTFVIGLFLLGCASSYEARGAAHVSIGELEVIPLPSPSGREAAPPTTAPSALSEELCSLRWIAFAPTQFDPQKKVFPNQESLWDDLQVLRRAGFEGLITYGADLEPELARLAQKAGFRGMIVGVWDPGNKEEIARAGEAAHSQIVVGLAVGNEGLGVRYGRETLTAAIEELRQATRKPVTTTEQIEDYTGDHWLLHISSFILPNVHAYWHGITDPRQAADWTEEQFHYLATRTTKPILFKEVGLPSGGYLGASEQNQAEYYRLLAQRKICFAYFEFADQPWKQGAAVEPHWGLFRQDRSPKLAAQMLLDISAAVLPNDPVTILRTE